MQSKYGKFYADWRDEKGRRHRRAFPTATQAARHAAKQTKLAAAKKAKTSAR